jgi:hypothetical protein
LEIDGGRIVKSAAFCFRFRIWLGEIEFRRSRRNIEEMGTDQGVMLLDFSARLVAVGDIAAGQPDGTFEGYRVRPNIREKCRHPAFGSDGTFCRS